MGLFFFNLQLYNEEPLGEDEVMLNYQYCTQDFSRVDEAQLRS